ncbi:type II toxin-antitoxin system VapC family toxin [Planosporangium thailandense]|uniref:Ribonuclease VapC n=1 Tax=Planosporangium thailandense TaxID=765197 RepID=A0ABX0XUM1_9ACTN|nr:type II toxin-antitoxin system VapC family toxin [Planosporangium thailandense]
MSAPKPPHVLVFDASALVAWVIQAQDRWRRVHKLFGSPAECVIPASALTETIYIARELGNTATPAEIRSAFLAQGLRVEPVTEEDAEWAGPVIAESRANPARWKTNKGDREGTLSLGDGLILAVAHRLGARAVTFDGAWANFPTLKLALLDPWKVPN